MPPKLLVPVSVAAAFLFRCATDAGVLSEGYLATALLPGLLANVFSFYLHHTQIGRLQETLKDLRVVLGSGWHAKGV